MGLDFEFQPDTLLPWNTHWVTGQVSPLVLRHPQPRAMVRPVLEVLRRGARGEWLLVVGARQIGKTTSLGHLAAGLLDAGAAPRQVAIVPMDQPPLQGLRGRDLGALVEGLGKLHVPTPDAPLYLLLDEVQEMEDWAASLKAAWDRYHPAVRVVATGSSAMRIIRPANADFPGRIRTSTMFPMKFREVVEGHPRFPSHAGSLGGGRLAAAAREVRAALAGTEGHAALLERLREFHLTLHADATLPAFLASTFLAYCTWGGYPAARPGTDIAIADRRQVFEQAWNALLAKDLPSTDVRKTREFTLLFHRIASASGGKFVASKVGGDFGVKGETVAAWKRILEDALLVQQLRPMKPNLRPLAGKDKAYVTDPGWQTFVLGVVDPADVLGKPLMGALVETVLVDHLRRLQFNLAGTTSLGLGYVSEPEVDVVAQVGRRWLAVEVKYRAQPHAAFEGLPEDTWTIVATRDHFELPDGASPGPIFLPAWELALLC